MATNKPTATPNAARRKSSKSSMIIKLKLSPDALKSFAPSIKEESPIKDFSSATSKTLPVAATSNGDVKLVDSASNTPLANGTPVPSSMPPPTEVVKKKGVKRSSGVALGPDAPPKVRGKPGPKKKARLEDGSIDHSNSAPRAAPGTAAHKLGPRANQGAINAGLRALDRSGKPCRKWAKGTFNIKSFTGVVWELPRWTAPPRITAQLKSDESASGDSSKENKDSSQVESEKSNSGPDIEMTNAPVLPQPLKSETTLPIAKTTTPPVLSSPLVVSAPAA